MTEHQFILKDAEPEVVNLLCERCSVCPKTFHNLSKIPPRTACGRWRRVVLKISTKLGVPPEELFTVITPEECPVRNIKGTVGLSQLKKLVSNPNYPTVNLSREDREYRLQKTLDEVLTERQKKVLVLRFLEDVSVKDIADTLGVSCCMVGVILNEARLKLRRYCQSRDISIDYYL
jgi:RNA polymerase sigma factor (sigma-70 family)